MYLPKLLKKSLKNWTVDFFIQRIERTLKNSVDSSIFQSILDDE